MSKIFSIFAVRKIGMLAMNRFREWCDSIWQRVCAAARPLRLWLGRVREWVESLHLPDKWRIVAGKLREWAAVVRVWLEPVRQWWLRLSEKYAAQQEVIKRQSEVSHERITMKRAILTFMETWGLGSRNIFYTAWHLLWRPGHVISDYLNGRRNRYLQPFFMFFVLTLILVQLAWLLNVQPPKNEDMTLTAYGLLRDHKEWFTPEQATRILDAAKWLDVVHDWRDENRGWDILIQSIGVILATWLLWRNSPRVGETEWVVESGELLKGYNFAEIVTAITYILCQLQLVSMVAIVLFRQLPFDHIHGLQVIVPKLILFVILLIDFKQLFQREWWPTLWRTAVIVLFV